MLGQWMRGYHDVAHLGSDSFVLKIPLYLAIGALMENGRSALLLTTVILNVTGFTLFFVSVRYFAGKLTAGRPHLFIAPLLWVVSLGVVLATVLINPNLRNAEIGVAFFFLMLAAQYWHGERTFSPTWFAVGVALLGLFLYNDPYFLFVFVVPLVALFLATLIVGRAGRPAVVLAAFLSAGAVAYKLWELALRPFGLHPDEADASLVSLGEMREHARLLVDGGLRLFEADVFAQQALVSRAQAVLNLAVLAFLAFYPLVLWKDRRRFAEEPWKWSFAAWPVFIATAFVVSSQAVDVRSVRYLVLIPFVAVLIGGIILHAIATTYLRRSILVLLVGATVLNVISTYRSYRVSSGGANATNYALIAAVRDNGLTKGYADYWSSNINTYLSKDQVDFIQVRCKRARVEPYLWLTDDAILDKPARRSFYLWETGVPAADCRYDDVVRQFGTPARVVDVADKKLLVYDYDLLTRMRRL